MASDDDKDKMIATLQRQLAAVTIGDEGFKTPFYKQFMKDPQGMAKDTDKLKRDGSNFVEWRSSINSSLLLVFPDINCFLNDKSNFDNLLKHEKLAVCHHLKTSIDQGLFLSIKGDECSGKELLQLLETECYGSSCSWYLELTRKMLDIIQLTDPEQSIIKWNDICAAAMESKLLIDQILGLLIQATVPPPSQYQADLFHQNIQAILDREDNIAGYRLTIQVTREELGKLKRMGKFIDDSIYVAKAILVILLKELDYQTNHLHFTIHHTPPQNAEKTVNNIVDP
ncbi:hypothetical protein BY996DRAFT_6414896 [Phakopsora pachyrhizi]|nr:hypothetical protein BY996DRAFT_6414896 [Phakopsora pachyrhizi]